MPVDLLLAALIVFGAMVIRAYAGFGGALLMVPLLGLVWDIRLAIIVVGCIQIVTGLMLVGMARSAIDRPALAPLLLWSLAGLVAGGYMLARLPVEWLATILGVVTIIIGVVSLGKRVRIARTPGRSEAVLTSAVGLTGGFFHGLIGTSGPVVVPYLQRVLDTPFRMRSTLLAYFLVLDVLRIGGYAQLGLVSGMALKRSALLIPVAIIGSLIGSRIHVQVSPDVFRISVAVLLIISGGLLLT